MNKLIIILANRCLERHAVRLLANRGPMSPAQRRAMFAKRAAGAQAGNPAPARPAVSSASQQGPAQTAEEAKRRGKWITTQGRVAAGGGTISEREDVLKSKGTPTADAMTFMPRPAQPAAPRITPTDARPPIDMASDIGIVPKAPATKPTVAMNGESAGGKTAWTSDPKKKTSAADMIKRLREGGLIKA